MQSMILQPNPCGFSTHTVSKQCSLKKLRHTRTLYTNSRRTKPLLTFASQADSQGDNDTAPALTSDWRAFRAKLISSEWQNTDHHSDTSFVVPIQAPEAGCLLIGRHSMLGPFTHTIILMLEHEDSVGSVGLVINMPMHTTIKSCGVEEHITQAFGDLQLAVGGPMQRTLLNILHTNPDVEGSTQVLPGLYSGGVHHASNLVIQNEADKRDFHLICGYSGWGPYQLAHEIEREDWYVVSAASEVIVDILNQRQQWHPDLVEVKGTEQDSKRESWATFMTKYEMNHWAM